MSRDRIVQVKDHQVFLSPLSALKFDQTNLPHTSFSFSPKAFFWGVEILAYDRASKSLLVKVKDYYPINISGFESQQLKHPIDFIEFEPLQWKFLEPFLATYRKQDLIPFIVDSDETYVPDLTPKTFKFPTKVSLSDLRFRSGYISFFQYLPMIGEEEEVRIYNDHIRPEFELIKSIFSKMLKKKHFEIQVEVEMVGTRLSKVIGNCEGLSRIDEDFIKTIKYSRILGLGRKPIVKSIDKSLFTADQAFDAFDDSNCGNVFNQDILDIIRTLSDHGAVRNRNQLQYLAGRKHLDQHKIYLTLKPVFGFIFTLEGQKMFHFCWELLNSHATYLWSFEKKTIDIDYAYNRVEKTIQSIRDHGRERYRQCYQRGDVDADLLFQVIVHRNAGSQVQDPFPEWRQRLEEKLL